MPLCQMCSLGGKMRDEALLEVIGLRPILVENLGPPALLLHDHSILLIDSRADLDAVSSWALSEAALLASRTSGPQ